MAEKNKKKTGRPRKLHKSDPDFFEVIGGRGGKKTKANNGSDYFARIARLAHISRRRNKRNALLAQSQGSGTDQPGDNLRQAG